MAATHATDEASPAPMGGSLVYRQPLPVRLWHWSNALAIFVLLMSGLMIFNAHPRLYWGHYGANPDHAWFEIGRRGSEGFARLGDVTIKTTGILGAGNGSNRAFPPLVTIPSSYDLAGARKWHFAFAWLLVVPGLMFLAWAILRGHLRRDLALTRDELRPAHLWADIKDHARLRFPKGAAARAYNPLQKLAYLSVILVLIPVVVLTGLTMSPAMNAGWPWLVDVFGGRQSARSLHFLCAAGFAGFIAVHLAMVLLAGPLNELRSIVTGWYWLPRDKP